MPLKNAQSAPVAPPGFSRRAPRSICPAHVRAEGRTARPGMTTRRPSRLSVPSGRQWHALPGRERQAAHPPAMTQGEGTSPPGRPAGQSVKDAATPDHLAGRYPQWPVRSRTPPGGKDTSGDRPHSGVSIGQHQGILSGCQARRCGQALARKVGSPTDQQAGPPGLPARCVQPGECLAKGALQAAFPPCPGGSGRRPEHPGCSPQPQRHARKVR
jgi:hypothetical protein